MAQKRDPWVILKFEDLIYVIKKCYLPLVEYPLRSSNPFNPFGIEGTSFV